MKYSLLKINIKIYVVKLKLSNKILEAVNRGIQLALDDYDDNEPNSSLSQHNDVINSEDVIKQRIELNKIVVDLGLPSETLWCKYNLGVNPNYLTKPEDWYGDYYAWGETESKTQYDWSNYQYANGESNKLTKYCNKSTYGNDGFTDKLTQLVPTDDIATVTNSVWRIPTKEDFEELIAGTTNSWVTDYHGISGLNGRVFTSKVNRNTLFIPAAGYHFGSNDNVVGSYCDLWSSSLCLDGPCYAYELYFNSGSIRMYGGSRYGGLSVRPVLNL